MTDIMYTSLVLHELQKISTNMLLIIFLGLIAKLTWVCGDCDVGTSVVDDYDFTKVGISELTSFLIQLTFKRVALVYNSFVSPLNNCL